MTRHAAVNEYDSHAVIATVHPQSLARPDSPELYRQHFRLLKTGLLQWAEGCVSPQGMPSYADFVGGITGVLAEIAGRENKTTNQMIATLHEELCGLLEAIPISRRFYAFAACATCRSRAWMHKPKSRPYCVLRWWQKLSDAAPLKPVRAGLCRSQPGHGAPPERA